MTSQETTICLKFSDVQAAESALIALRLWQEELIKDTETESPDEALLSQIVIERLRQPIEQLLAAGIHDYVGGHGLHYRPLMPPTNPDA